MTRPKPESNVCKRTFLASAFAATILLPAIASAQDLQFGGFFSNGYIKSSEYNYLVDSEEGDFDFMEIGLNASWTPRERTTVNGQLFAFELGPYGNFDPQIDYLFVDYNAAREFGVRFGRIKREFGVYTHVQDIDIARPTVILPIGIYDPRYRDFSAFLDGVSFYGSIPLGSEQSIDYNLYGGHIDLQPDGGVAGLALTSVSRDAIDPKLLYIESSMNYGAQLWYAPPVDGLRVGLAWLYYANVSFATEGTIPYDSPNPYFAGQLFQVVSSDVDMMIKSLSFEYYVGEWNFVGEVVETRTTLNYFATVGPIPVYDARIKGTNRAWFLSGSRRFDKFEGAVTYTEYNNYNDEESAIAGLTSYTNDWQISLRYDATDFWSLKAEYHFIEGTSQLFNQLGQNPVLDAKRWNLFAMKSTFYF